jgi:hypothetical protein
MVGYPMIVSAALEEGETLTVRILDVSRSKRTILVNRGLEDGVVQDQHARFFLTGGVVARGVAAKVAQNRSVWSVYRIVYPDEIVVNNVLQMAVTRPLQTTDDPSRAIRHVPAVAGRLPRDMNEIPLADGSDGFNINRLEGRSSLSSQEGRGSFYGRAR